MEVSPLPGVSCCHQQRGMEFGIKEELRVFGGAGSPWESREGGHGSPCSPCPGAVTHAGQRPRQGRVWDSRVNPEPGRTHVTGWGAGGVRAGGAAGDPSLPSPPPSPSPSSRSPAQNPLPRSVPVPSIPRHGRTGLPGLPPASPARGSPGAAPASLRLRARCSGAPPAAAAAQPPARPLPAVPGGAQPGSPRRGRAREAAVPARGCRYRGAAGRWGGPGPPTPPGPFCFSSPSRFRREPQP